MMKQPTGWILLVAVVGILPAAWMVTAQPPQISDNKAEKARPSVTSAHDRGNALISDEECEECEVEEFPSTARPTPLSLGQPPASATANSAPLSAAERAPMSGSLPVGTSGECLTYRFTYHNQSKTDWSAMASKLTPASSSGGTASSTGNQIQVDFQGEMELTTIEKHSAFELIACRFRDSRVKLVIDGETMDPQAGVAQEQLQTSTVFLKRNKQGRVLTLWFASASDPFVCGLSKTLLAAMQYVVPAVSTSRRAAWSVQEQDQNGTYLARYQKAKSRKPSRSSRQPAEQTIHKTIVRYLPSGVATPSVTIQPAGTSTIRLSSGRNPLLALSGVQTQRMTYAGKPVGWSETRLNLHRTAHTTVVPTRVAELLQYSRRRQTETAGTTLAALLPAPDTEARSQRTLLGNATWETLAAELKQRETSSLAGTDDTALYLKLKALLAFKPETAQDCIALLLHAAPASPTWRLLTGALATVGHSQAQTALVEVCRARKGEWLIMAQLLPVLGNQAAPTLQTENALRGIAFGKSFSPAVGSTAQLALGVMAAKLADGSPDRSAALVREFIAQLKSARSEADKEQWLLVIGNTAANAAQPHVAKCLNDASVAVRGAAVTALRGMTNRTSERLLRRVLTGDANEHPRAVAADILGSGFPSADSLNALRRAVQFDRSGAVRFAALNGIRQIGTTLPSARRLLRDIAEGKCGTAAQRTLSEMTAKPPQKTPAPRSDL
jgi:hypothetical protein